MPPVAHTNQRKIRQHRLSKIALVVLFILLSIGLAIWLYWSMREKQIYRQPDAPKGADSTG